MTSIESRSYCRVVVIAPSTRVDLALPADVPVIDLLPMLLQYAGEVRDDGGGQHGGWKLVRVGHGELDGGGAKIPTSGAKARIAVIRLTHP